MMKMSVTCKKISTFIRHVDDDDDMLFETGGT